jgi:hypothetical protein
MGETPIPSRQSRRSDELRERIGRMGVYSFGRFSLFGLAFRTLGATRGARAALVWRHAIRDNSGTPCRTCSIFVR